MDKDKYKLGKTREKKPEGYLSSEELFDFFQKKKIFIKRKDNLPRFCDQHNIQMIKFKREGSGGTTPTAYRIPSDTKINQIKQKLMLNNNSILGLELIKKKENKILQIFDEAKNQQESKNNLLKPLKNLLSCLHLPGAILYDTFLMSVRL